MQQPGVFPCAFAGTHVQGLLQLVLPALQAPTSGHLPGGGPPVVPPLDAAAPLELPPPDEPPVVVPEPVEAPPVELPVDDPLPVFPVELPLPVLPVELPLAVVPAPVLPFAPEPPWLPGVTQRHWSPLPCGTRPLGHWSLGAGCDRSQSRLPLGGLVMQPAPSQAAASPRAAALTT